MAKVQAEKERSVKKNQSYYCEVLNQKFSNYTTYSNRTSTKKYQKAFAEYKARRQEEQQQSGEQSAGGSVLPSDSGSVVSSSADTFKTLDKAMAQATPALDPAETVLAENFKKKERPPTTLDNLCICLFSDVMYDSFETNLREMHKNYGFFIPDEKSCKSKEKLIKHLAKVIQIKKTCIFCGRVFSDPRAVQRHMVEKRHTFINTDYFGDVEKFYDFNEENRRVALEIQEKIKRNQKVLGIEAGKADDNDYVFTIKQKKEKKPQTMEEEIKEDGESDSEGEWEDDSEEDEDDGRFSLCQSIDSLRNITSRESRDLTLGNFFSPVEELLATESILNSTNRSSDTETPRLLPQEELKWTLECR